VQRLGESGHGARPTQNASALDVKPFAQRIVTRRRRAEGDSEPATSALTGWPAPPS